LISDRPTLRFVGDTGVLIEFGDQVEQAIHEQVMKLDRLVNKNPFVGFISSIPSYTALLVRYDPCQADRIEVTAHITSLLQRPSSASSEVHTHQIPICYDQFYAPDLQEVATKRRLTTEAVIKSHLSATYRVYMYGFAPGFAYLGGVPEVIQVPRRAEPVRGVPAGSVIIAGRQCIVTTLEMPSGWWNIGRSPAAILRPEAERPFLFNVGDHVRFVSIDLSEFAKLQDEKSS
jgi:inhibitor of KinA